MFRFILGVAMGWMAFTEEGKKTANMIGQKTMNEVKKTLKETGLFNDVPKTNDTEDTGS